MSAEYKNADLNKLAQDAERDLNTDAAKKGHGSDAGTLSPLPDLESSQFYLCIPSQLKHRTKLL